MSLVDEELAVVLNSLKAINKEKSDLDDSIKASAEMIKEDVKGFIFGIADNLAKACEIVREQYGDVIDNNYDNLNNPLEVNFNGNTLKIRPAVLTDYEDATYTTGITFLTNKYTAKTNNNFVPPDIRFEIETDTHILESPDRCIKNYVTDNGYLVGINKITYTNDYHQRGQADIPSTFNFDSMVERALHSIGEEISLDDVKETHRILKESYEATKDVDNIVDLIKHQMLKDLTSKKDVLVNTVKERRDIYSSLQDNPQDNISEENMEDNDDIER